MCVWKEHDYYLVMQKYHASLVMEFNMAQKHIRIKSVKEVREDLDNGRKTRNLIMST